MVFECKFKDMREIKKIARNIKFKNGENKL